MSLLKTNKITDVAGNVIAEPITNIADKVIAGPGLLSNAPYVRVRLDTTNNHLTINDDTETVIPFAIKDVDAGNNFNNTDAAATANGIARMPYSFCAADLGHYQVNLRLQFEDAIDDADFECELKIKNNILGAVYLLQNTLITNGRTGINVNTVVPVETTANNIFATIKFDKSSNSRLLTSSVYNYMEIYRLLGV